MVLPKRPVSAPLLLGEKMKKYKCAICEGGYPCILIVPDEGIEPQFCPVDSMRAKWRQVVRVEVVVPDGMAL